MPVIVHEVGIMIINQIFAINLIWNKRFCSIKQIRPDIWKYTLMHFKVSDLLKGQ